MNDAWKRGVVYGGLGFTVLLGTSILIFQPLLWLTAMWFRGVSWLLAAWLVSVALVAIWGDLDDEAHRWLWLQPLPLLGPIGALVLAAARFGSDAASAEVIVVSLLAFNLLGMTILVAKRSPSPWTSLTLTVLVLWGSAYSLLISFMAINDDWL